MSLGSVATSLVTLLAANETAWLTCVCNFLGDVDENGNIWDLTEGEASFWNVCDLDLDDENLWEVCDNMDQLLFVLNHVRAPNWRDGPVQPADSGECGGALAAIRNHTYEEAEELSWILLCRIAADCVDSCSVQGSNDTDWNEEVLEVDDVRDAILSQSLRAAHRVTTAARVMKECARKQFRRAYNSSNLQAYLDEVSSYWRDQAQLVSLGVPHVTKLLVPLAFEYMNNYTSDHRSQGWMKHMKRVEDMFNMALMSLVRDVQSVSELIANYKMVEDKTSPGEYTIRRPLLSEKLLSHQPQYLYFRDYYGGICEEQQPNASRLFGVADALYSFYYDKWMTKVVFLIITEDEKWQLEDQSNTTLSVDTDCMQLLADSLDRPACPLEDPPPETASRRQQCRQQLWEDLVQRRPRPPVTSYLAYTQRASVNLCLLAWMVVNPYGLCQHLPFSMVRSVRDALCHFDSPDNHCPESNATDVICSVARAILLLKCKSFFYKKPLAACGAAVSRNGSFTEVESLDGDRETDTHITATSITLSFKNSLSSATLKYKNFKVESLQLLEISFILVNILFRVFSVGLYIYLPHLRNLPGKILLSFQTTGLIQVLCSEVLYRMIEVPDLATAVLIDSSLTLLSCFWLNTFCYQMYACVRNLRLPNDLLPVEANKIFRNLVFSALIPWIIVSATNMALEKTGRYYVFMSRIIFLVVISLSVVFNLVFLLLLGYTYLHTRSSIRQLEIYNKEKFASKKQLLYLSVKTVILSGIGIIIRIGFHQAEGIAQFVYYVHIATMMQGPVLFVFFICNGTTLPVLKNRALKLWDPNIISPGQELCSAAERNLERKKNEMSPTAESSL